MTLPSETRATLPGGHRIELLAPAGDERGLRAALAAGADAVYLGLERFSARAFADNFGPAELLEAIDRAHLWGARVHLALNTQLKQEEVGPALRALEAPYAAGLDALIVADLGFASHVRRSFPELALHASTQLNTHSSAQLEALAALGFRRAVLARELSLNEIGTLQAHGIELEAFVHGALCYGYSGNCLFASMVGGRSGNRGRCTQACRMRYALRPAGAAARPVAAGRPSPAREAGAAPPAGRVLSASDLAALEALPQLLAVGVSAFKIEGRMKDAGYVATATAVYREALQAALADADGFSVLPEWRRRLEQSFSRGFTTAHLQGRHAEVRSRDRGGHRGVQVGRVDQIDEAQGRVVVRLSEPVGAGDVLTIFTPWGQSEPVRVPLEALGGAPAKGQTSERLVLHVRERVAVKDRVFRLSAAAADAYTEDAVAGRVVARPLLLDVELEAAVGDAPRLRVHAGALDVQVSGEGPLAVAERARLNAGRARDAVGALGGTPYRLAEFHAHLQGDPFLPVGALKELRRRALAELDARRLAPWRRPLVVVPQVDQAPPTTAAPQPTRLPLPVVLRVRPGEAPLPAPDVAAVALDVDVDDDPQAIAAVVRGLAGVGLGVRCRPPEVLFDGDLLWWCTVAALPWEAIYARSLAHLSGGSAAARILEYPLQGLSADTALLLRPSAVVAGPEASLPEVADLAGRLAAGGHTIAVEAFVFGRQQLLLTRDVLGQAEGLASGERTALELVDAKDFIFPAEAAPQGTRIFNSRVTNLATAQAELAAAGISAAIVVQRDLAAEEREAFATGGLAALAAFAGRERSTTGHLFRGVV